MCARLSLKDIEIDRTIIHEYTTQDDLKKQLSLDVSNKSIRGAHWFKEADLWYRINTGYNNPLNYGNVHSELLLINREGNLISQLLSKKRLFFWGVGVGDTEMALVDLQLNNSQSSETVLLDINPVFLHMFIESLRIKNLEASTYEIKYLAFREFFENASLDSLNISDEECSGNAIICLGSTIGNYSDTHTILDMFDQSAKSNDVILVGYQLQTQLDVIYKKYATSDLYRNLVGNFLTANEKTQIEWKLNRDNSAIEAWLDNMQLFRSKKFTCEFVKCIAHEYKWDEVFCFTDSYENFCLHAFMKA